MEFKCFENLVKINMNFSREEELLGVWKNEVD